MQVLDENDPKTKDFLVKIGETVVVFNHLESMVEFNIWELIAASGNAHVRQSIGKRITTTLEYMQKVDLLRSLIVERFGEEKDKLFKEVYTTLQECSEIRNDIAHSLWYIQYGNLEEGIELDTAKINIKKAFEKGKFEDFSKVYETISRLLE